MSGPERVSLRGAPGAALRDGVADVFLVGADGQRWPVTTVTGPLAMVGPAGGDVDLVAVGRIGATIEVLSDPPSAAELTQWVDAIAKPLGVSALTGADPQGVAARLTSGCADALATRLARQSAARSASQAADDDLIGRTKARLVAGVDRAGYTDDAPAVTSTSPLIEVFRILGDHQGFTVTQPRRSALTSGNPVRAVAEASGLRFRGVRLSDGWSTRTKTPLLAFAPSAAGPPEPVALLPTRRGYLIQRSGELEPSRLSDAELQTLAPSAIQLYVPLPHDRPATLADMGRLASRGTGRLWALIVACAAAAAVLALATPALTSSVLDMLVPAGSSSAVVAVGVILVVVAISSGLLTMVQNFATSELTQLGQLRVESALWDRTLSLPLKFFRGYSSGDMVTRLTVVDQLKNLLSSQTVTAILGAVLSLVNFALLLTYSWQLAVAALIVIVAAAIAIVKLTLVLRDLSQEQLTAQRGANSWIVQLISGIGKIRVAGAEDRFTALTMDVEAQMINAQAKQTVVMGRLQAFLGAIAAVAPMMFFFVVAQWLWSPSGATITTGTYIAFSTAFGTVLGAIIGLVNAVPAIAMISPTMELITPILDSVQTQSVDARPIPALKGRIELRDVTFQYRPETPAVLRDLSMIVNEGELTAIVGPSGSGKTTTLRMITGIESPDSGQVLIDGHDLRDIDGDDYRRRIGTVIQGGQLSPGSILDNIAGGAEITEADAWAAAESAAIADDIRAMPMHMQSVVNAQTISGGQAQRILIARALARKPRILLFDEATSALDNESQATVMAAMAELQVTRVVVAHRLSTVMGADRILVVDAGRLVEQGTYDELMAAKGLFAELAARQLAS
ncbi:MAG: ATP-binding cassette domain-containing protein [Candidatus Nanopelagicales bacterium]